MSTKRIFLSVPPKRLFPRLQEAKWNRCDSVGFDYNYSGFQIGAYSLTKPKDDLCSAHVRVKIEDPESGLSHTVEGWSFPSIYAAFGMIGTKDTVFGGKKTHIADLEPSLRKSKSKPYAYKISIEDLDD